MAMSHQYPPARSASVNGSGNRAHQRSQNPRITCGLSPSHSRCSPAGSSQEANPLASSANPMPARAACRLAHSCPLTHTFAG